MPAGTAPPVSEVDLFTEAALMADHPLHCELREMVEFAMTETRPGVIDPDGLVAALFDAADKGDLPADKWAS